MDKFKDKSVLFFSSSSAGDCRQLLDFNIKELLVSYFYIKKSFSSYDEILKRLKASGGIFMTDSGAFSFMGLEHGDEAYSPEYWIPYIEEYVSWLYAHKDYVYVAANMDLDKIVGREVVREWNEKYFEPLQKYMEIVYVAHETDGDPKAEAQFTEYCRKYDYVGVNRALKKNANMYCNIANKYNTRIHGFAWTEIALLKRYPFFSVDSTTWLSGVRYGSTYDYDGKNCRTYDSKKKYLRKAKKVKYLSGGVDYYGMLEEKSRDINDMNLLAWVGFREEYLKSANFRLKNKPVAHYEREH